MSEKETVTLTPAAPAEEDIDRAFVKVNVRRPAEKPAAGARAKATAAPPSAARAERPLASEEEDEDAHDRRWDFAFGILATAIFALAWARVVREMLFPLTFGFYSHVLSLSNAEINALVGHPAYVALVGAGYFAAALVAGAAITHRAVLRRPTNVFAIGGLWLWGAYALASFAVSSAQAGRPVLPHPLWGDGVATVLFVAPVTAALVYDHAALRVWRRAKTKQWRRYVYAVAAPGLVGLLLWYLTAIGWAGEMMFLGYLVGVAACVAGTVAARFLGNGMTRRWR